MLLALINKFHIHKKSFLFKCDYLVVLQSQWEGCQHIASFL